MYFVLSYLYGKSMDIVGTLGVNQWVGEFSICVSITLPFKLMGKKTHVQIFLPQESTPPSLHYYTTPLVLGMGFEDSFQY